MRARFASDVRQVRLNLDIRNLQAREKIQRQLALNLDKDRQRRVKEEPHPVDTANLVRARPCRPRPVQEERREETVAHTGRPSAMVRGGWRWPGRPDPAAAQDHVHREQQL